uniref:Ion_trans_2 domain-containing protein n=1 Tax=Heterorhabditis bacteriophora TaxID=37862 RepID=A0A1I7XJ73_HETBA
MSWTSEWTMDLNHTIVIMQGIISEMANDVMNVTLTYNGTQREEKLGKMIQHYYKTMLEAEGRFHGSVWHKAENLDLHLMWYFSSATFYSMTLFTTIGYGTIACQTFWGRVLSVVYACIGIPLMLVVLGDIGEWFQKILTKIFVFILIKWKQVNNKQSIKMCMNYSPFLAAAFLLGLALISIVNTSIYAQLYDMFFNFVEAIEKNLERIHSERFRGHGYRIFQYVCIIKYICFISLHFILDFILFYFS